MTNNNISKFVIALSLILYISSLTQTAYCTSGCKDSITALLFGLLGVLVELGAIANWVMDKFHGKVSANTDTIGATFTWFANPIFIFSTLVLLHNQKVAFVFSLLSTLLILSFMSFDSVIDNEAGHYNKVTELKLGYWLWLSSSITILLGSSILIFKNKDFSRK